MQVPVVPQDGEVVTAHLPWGSGALSATAMQRPGVAVRLQAMHAWVQAFSQHTPWAQNPDWHSAALLQGCPDCLGPHEEFTQNFPDTHCLSLVQLA
jgi:hypothetical protein